MPWNTTPWTRPRGEPRAHDAHLLDDLPRLEVAREAHPPGRAERARERAADLRAHAHREALRVLERDAHRLEPRAVGAREQRTSRTDRAGSPSRATTSRSAPCPPRAPPLPRCGESPRSRRPARRGGPARRACGPRPGSRPGTASTSCVRGHGLKREHSAAIPQDARGGTTVHFAALARGSRYADIVAYPEVIRVFATSQDPDFDGPWQARTPSNSTGSAVVIGNGLLLTGAHVVANATFLQVQKPSPSRQGDRAGPGGQPRLRPGPARGRRAARLPRRHRARRARRRCPSCATRSPWSAIRSAARRSRSPRAWSRASRSSATATRQRHLLAVTVDAAINAGNSGGPVFGDGKVVGIAFQKLTGVDNIGEMVPPPTHPRVPRWRASRQAPGDPGARHHDAEPREPAAAPPARAQPERARRGRAARRLRRLGRRHAAAARRDHRDRRPADREQRHGPVHRPATAPATTSCSAIATSATASSSRSSAPASRAPSSSSSSRGCRSCRARATTSRPRTSSTAASCSRP